MPPMFTPSASWGTPDSPQPQDRARARSTTVPQVYHPPLLTVAHPMAAGTRSSIHNPDVLFLEAPAASTPPPLPTSPIPPRLPYPADHVSPATLRRVRTAPPPVPPHPYNYASTPSSPPVPLKELAATAPPQLPDFLSGPPQDLPPAVPERPDAQEEQEPEAEDARQTPQEDDAELAELAAVLALSQAETLRQEKLQRKMVSQEEADLARALEASMSTSSWSYSSADGGHTAIEAGSSNQTPTPSTTEFPRVDYMDDAAFARMLAAQEQEDDPTPTHNGVGDGLLPEPPNLDAQFTADSLPMYQAQRLPLLTGELLSPSDEELARRLAVEEERLAQETKDKPPNDPPDQPAYSDAQAPTLMKGSPEPPDLVRTKSVASELKWVDATLESEVMVIDATQRPASVDATNFRRSSGILHAPETIRQPSSLSLRSDDSDVTTRSANQYIDTDLLRGVSIGFVAPSITPELVPLAGSMPDIISLPYGRCPPLHLQAPNWRHLLKLMARLSGTRFEPTVEALAVTRSAQLHLRTVVQFVRPHHSSADWRTVLWFTIDHPVPTSLPGGRKYTNGDVDVLPWSYTLSSLPALLRDNSDTMLSKCYTIPSSDSVPFPALPITFPNMAMYLQAALEESRRYANDSSSGLRKLAKMVETCYPNGESSDDGERSRVGGLFKKVIGRGRKDKMKKGKGGNEDTYELVTPFVLDEWGP